MTMYLPGTRFLFDTSALMRAAKNPDVLKIIEVAIDDGVAATCDTVDLEIGYSARDAATLKTLRASRQEHYVHLPVTPGVGARAMEIQELMAQRGLHRAAGAMDLMTAAIAEAHRAIIVHYDADFEYIALVTGQRQQWVAPRGSID